MLGLVGNMSKAEIQRQAALAALYVFWIMVIAFYGGQAIMNVFGISLPGLRIGGGLIVSYIGFRMLFPPPAHSKRRRPVPSASNCTTTRLRILPLCRWPCPPPPALAPLRC